MLEEDRHALRELKAHFEELAVRIDGGATIPSIDLSYYHVVYRAATRNAKPSEYPGYDVGELLYMDYQEMLTSYLLRHADVNASSDVEVFKKVLDIWSRYTQLFKWNARTFSYLSRYYIVNHSKPSLRQVACSIFLEQIFKKTSGSMTQVALQFLVQERDGVPVDRVLIKGALDLFASMGIEGMESEYSKEFLWSFLEYMKKECMRMAESWKSCTAQQFLTRMQRALQEEMERCDHYFSSADKKSILSCMEEGLGDALPTVEKLLNSEDGFRRFLAQRDKDHLEAYYSMFCKRETWLQNLGVILKSHIESEATELGRKYEGDENAKDALNYVCAMFSLFESISAIVTQCFHGEFVMAKAAREGFDRAFAGGLPVRCEKTGKSRQIPFGECLAHYMDWLLKQNHESQQTVEAEMNRVVGILGIQSDRDCFIRTAGDLMAERIVFPEYTYDEEKEKLFIQKLKQRCGPSSTTHLESMQNDLTVSNAFRATETLTSLGKAPSFQVTWLVGRKGMWPSWMTCDRAGLILPREVQQVLDDLSDAYLPQPSRRILMWSHECSNAELLGNFENNQAQTMCVTGVQAAVLLHFNAAAEYSIGELAARCGISSEDVMKALEPILQSTVLVARHGSPSATDSSRVKFNSHFCCRKKKLRLLPSRSRISVVGPSSSGTSSTSDVRPAVCAWIAKILKSRGKLSHSELMAECAAQLSRLYVVSSAMFKQAVEELVRKQIIERDRQQAGMYTYVP